MMVTHDTSDLSVVIDIRKDALADRGVLFHPPALFKRQGSRLLEKTSRKAHLPDVVDKAAKVGKLLLLLGQA
jgi:hypothetical protein